MRFAFCGGKHTWDTVGAQQGPLYLIYWEEVSLPEVIELVVPRPFLETPTVNGTDAIVDTVNADLIGPESDNITMFDVGGVDSAIFLVGESFYEDPEGGEGG